MMYVGNCYLRELVQSRREEYLSARHRKEKDDIANSVVRAIHEKDGRFLKKVMTDQERKKFNLSKGVDAWLCVDDSVAVEKVKQNFRDATSSSNVAASMDDKASHFAARNSLIVRSSGIAEHLQPASKLSLDTVRQQSVLLQSFVQEDPASLDFDSQLFAFSMMIHDHQRNKMLSDRLQVAAFLESISKNNYHAPSGISSADLLLSKICGRQYQRTTDVQYSATHPFTSISRSLHMQCPVAAIVQRSNASGQVYQEFLHASTKVYSSEEARFACNPTILDATAAMNVGSENVSRNKKRRRF
jgi:hypothetical protein